MTLGFLNIGTQEMIVIVIVILLLFGGKKLPELARGLGRGIREFKDASEGIKQEISDQINNFEKDLDVTAEETPAPKSKDQQPLAEDTPQQEDKPKEGANKEFPKFTQPENTVQHHPGQQPSSGNDQPSYGYEDHIADDESDAGGATKNV